MKLAVFGSRTLKDDRVRLLIHEAIIKHDAKIIITAQEPGGVCEVAQRCAKDLALPLKLHFLNFKFLRGAFEHRSKDIIRDSDLVLIIHDGISKGTANELEYCKKMKWPYEYHRLEVNTDARNEGFNISNKWELDLDWGKEILK